MFDRYTQQARRALFFAVHEAAGEGSPNVTTSHFLAGLMVDNDALAERALGGPDPVARLLHDLRLPAELRQNPHFDQLRRHP